VAGGARVVNYGTDGADTQVDLGTADPDTILHDDEVSSRRRLSGLDVCVGRRRCETVQS
jgi:hypothetical protein